MREYWYVAVKIKGGDWTEELYTQNGLPIIGKSEGAVCEKIPLSVLGNRAAAAKCQITIVHDKS